MIDQSCPYSGRAASSGAAICATERTKLRTCLIVAVPEKAQAQTIGRLRSLNHNGPLIVLRMWPVAQHYHTSNFNGTGSKKC
jgi:hypothetical protein